MLVFLFITAIGIITKDVAGSMPVHGGTISISRRRGRRRQLQASTGGNRCCQFDSRFDVLRVQTQTEPKNRTAVTMRKRSRRLPDDIVTRRHLSYTNTDGLVTFANTDGMSTYANARNIMLTERGILCSWRPSTHN